MHDSEADFGIFRGNFPHRAARLHFAYENVPLIGIELRSLFYHFMAFQGLAL